MAKNETGAPAAQKRLETHEADAEANVIRLKEQRDALIALDNANDQTDKAKSIRAQIADLNSSLTDAYDLWFKLSKQVREYDKSVALERRDGVKIPQVEVENILTQVFRFDRIAFETAILADAQEAIRCKDEQEYYRKYSDNHRTCRQQAIISGIEHEKFPAFVREAYERSL